MSLVSLASSLLVCILMAKGGNSSFLDANYPPN